MQFLIVFAHLQALLAGQRSVVAFPAARHTGAPPGARRRKFGPGPAPVARLWAFEDALALLSSVSPNRAGISINVVFDHAAFQALLCVSHSVRSNRTSMCFALRRPRAMLV